MTFDQLEVMEMIVEKGSFKAAAKALHRTQPTLSVSIKKLETEFDLILFNRESYRPKLTEEGELFYGWAQQCLRSFRSLEVVGKELGLKKTEARLTLVIDPIVRFEAIAAIFDTCLRPNAPTELTLRSEILCAGSELLLRGEADFAIAPRLAALEEIESIPLEKIDMLPVVAKKLIQGTTRLIDIEWLRQLPQIVVSSNSGEDREAIGLLEGGKRCLVSDHGMKRRLIKEGFGWGRLAAHEIIETADLHQIVHESVPPFVLDLHVMRSKLRPLGPLGRIVWNRLHDVASAQTPSLLPPSTAR